MTPQLLPGCRHRPPDEPKDKREAIRLRNRRAIITAAGELATERGMDRVSVNDLAARAGVSRRTIFNHFPSAQDAVFEYLSELVAGLIDRVLHELPQPAAPPDASLGDVYRQLIDALRSRSLIDELQPMFSVDVQDTPAASLWGFRVTRTAVQRLHEVLRERLPQYTPFQTHLVATTVINSLAECLDEWLARTGGVLDEQGRQTWDELLSTALDVLGCGFDS
ncbi:TetR/AcrR family transcriptional regulator [Kocuria tytonis]|uniref:TetR/AcrR family transcriptional regulator n=1 Tax=Kocuria tytonis TaxID=2054280 RepID=A0A495AA75_9MICC|nr:TetR/AcrR family transcriptional regulator [Kocuria tytonis]